MDAVNQIIQRRKKNYKLADIAKQTDMFADPDMVIFIELFALNPRSTRVAVDILWDAMEKARIPWITLIPQVVLCLTAFLQKN